MMGLGWLLAGVTLALAGGDAEEISRSRGTSRGVVVLWPRVVPASQDATLQALASELQARLATVAQARVDPRRVDVRPPPQRVCPIEGCRAVELGVFLGHDGGGCAAVAMVGAPGEAPRQWLPLAGAVTFAQDALPFRQAPEALITVTEFVPCDALLERLDLSGVEAALAKVLATP